MGILVVIIVGLIASALGFVCWNYPLKQYDQVVFRSSTIMTIVCLYLMWAFAYMAQMNPLIQPKIDTTKGH